MKTIITNMALAFGMCWFAINSLAQATYPSNDPNANTPLGFIGWNVPNDNTDLNFGQNNTRRMRMTSIAWPGYNNAPAVGNSSRMHFSLTGTNNQFPFSMMHLGSSIGAALQRPWMHVGTTYGAGGDIMHVGIMQSPDPAGTQMGGDAVIAWGDNDDQFGSSDGPDNLRFLFISPTNVTSPGANSEQGRETMRITPMGNVGLGDFSTMPLGIAATYGQPRARLDVQFRNSIPLNTENTAVNVLNIAIDPLNTESPKIGIRAQATTNGVVPEAIGGRFRAERGTMTYGVYADVLGFGGQSSFGVFALAEENDNEARHFGVYGQARRAVQNIGVYGAGFGSLNLSIISAGIYGESGTQPNEFAGYFNGRVFHAGVLVPSDEFLKHDIVNVENATEILSQLVPKRYYYNQDIQLNLPVELQYGLLAQEVEAALPSLVSTITTPTFVDSTGQATSEPLTFKAMRYNDLTAILIAGFNEQAGTVANQAALIEEQNAEIIELKSQVAIQTATLALMLSQLISVQAEVQAIQAKTNNCCTFGSSQGHNDDTTGSLPYPTENSDGMKLMQNVPNPFDTTTRIDFILPADANVVLELSDVNGRPLRRLVDGQMNAGPQTLTLDGSSLAPGMYFYTVYANGELLTKKMVKK